MATTIFEIREEYERQKSNLVLQCFDLRAAALSREPTIPSATMAQLPRHESASVQAVESENWAKEERNRLQAEYVRLDIEERAALDVRLEEVERLLSPQDASPDDLLTASQASPDALNAAMDLALNSGLEEQALLFFSAGRQRDLDSVVSHAITIRPDWGELFAELMEAAKYPNLDEAELRMRFESVATEPPTRQDLKQAILTGPTSDLNQYGMMR